MTRATLDDLVGPGEFSNLALYLAPGVDVDAAVDRLRAAFAGQPLVFRSNSRLREEILAIFDQTFAITRILQVMALLIAVCGISLTLVIMARERAAELALLRAIGATRGQVLRLLVGEGGAMGVAGLLLGLAGGAGLAAILILLINRAYFGWTIRFGLPAGALAAAGGVDPGRRAGGEHPAGPARQPHGRHRTDAGGPAVSRARRLRLVWRCSRATLRPGERRGRVAAGRSRLRLGIPAGPLRAPRLQDRVVVRDRPARGPRTAAVRLPVHPVSRRHAAAGAGGRLGLVGQRPGHGPRRDHRRRGRHAHLQRDPLSRRGGPRRLRRAGRLGARLGPRARGHARPLGDPPPRRRPLRPASPATDRQGLALDLDLAPSRPLVLQGPGGFSVKDPVRRTGSLYYSITRLATAGTVVSGGDTLRGHGPELARPRDSSPASSPPTRSAGTGSACNWTTAATSCSTACAHKDGGTSAASGTLVERRRRPSAT